MRDMAPGQGLDPGRIAREWAWRPMEAPPIRPRNLSQGTWCIWLNPAIARSADRNRSGTPARTSELNRPWYATASCPGPWSTACIHAAYLSGPGTPGDTHGALARTQRPPLHGWLRAACATSSDAWKRRARPRLRACWNGLAHQSAPWVPRTSRPQPCICVWRALSRPPSGCMFLTQATARQLQC